jgi:hypothetical protein
MVGQALKKAKLTQPDEPLTAIAVCKWGMVKSVKELTAMPKERQVASNHFLNI